MSTTTGRTRRRTDRPTTERSAGVAASRYDLLLVVIPLAFLAAALAAFLLPLELPVALAGAATVGLLGILDGVYRNPPVPPQG